MEACRLRAGPRPYQTLPRLEVLQIWGLRRWERMMRCEWPYCLGSHKVPQCSLCPFELVLDFCLSPCDSRLPHRHLFVLW